MGIVIRQSIKGSIWSYLGVIVGFITTAYLYPKYLEPEVIGLFSLLVSWSALTGQFSSLGFHGVTARLFPYFRSKDNHHNGFLFLAFIVMIAGFIIFLVLFFYFRPWLIESNLEKSKLFSDYVNLLIPLTFFTIIYINLDTFNRLLYNAVFGAFLNEFLQRVFIIAILAIYIVGWLTLHELILAYAAAVSMRGFIIFFYLLLKGHINLRPDFSFIDKKLKKEIINVAAFSILAGIGGNIIFRIDKILVNQMLGIEQTGIYTIAFYFGTLVTIPSRTLLRISGTLIADAWKSENIPQLKKIYHKSCLNQFVIAALLLGILAVNINNIMDILGPEYSGSEWVILIVGFGFLINMSTGTNGQIIRFSKYYRMALWFLVILILVVVGSMYLFVPIFGMTGAAIAIALSFLINNLLRFIFLKVKFQMQPFTLSFLWVFLAFGLGYLPIAIIPDFNLIPDIITKSMVFFTIYSIVIIGFRVSEDINGIYSNILKRIGIQK